VNWLKFQERLKSLRETKGISAESMSLDMGFDKNCVWLWESGKRKPSTESIYKLAKHLSVSSDYLLGLGDNKSSHQ